MFRLYRPSRAPVQGAGVRYLADSARGEALEDTLARLAPHPEVWASRGLHARRTGRQPVKPRMTTVSWRISQSSPAVPVTARARRERRAAFHLLNWPQGLGSRVPTSCVWTPELSRYLAYSPTFDSSSPKDHRVSVPVRARYSHSALLGSRQANPVCCSVSQAAYATASAQITLMPWGSPCPHYSESSTSPETSPPRSWNGGRPCSARLDVYPGSGHDADPKTSAPGNSDLAGLSRAIALQKRTDSPSVSARR